MVASVLDDALGALGANVTEVVQGSARGVDQMAGQWAVELGLTMTAMPANWDKYGKRAGYIRNAEMVKLADCAIILWDRVSKGARHTIRLAHDKPIPYIVIARDPTPLARGGV